MSDEPEVIAKLRYLHAATVDWLTTECATTGVTISPILAAYDAIVAERDAAIAECHEQARLNGMGSEREARIMAERDALTARLAACEKIVEAAIAAQDKDVWDMNAHALYQAVEAYRAAVAAETCARSAPITVGDTQGENDA